MLLNGMTISILILADTFIGILEQAVVKMVINDTVYIRYVDDTFITRNNYQHFANLLKLLYVFNLLWNLNMATFFVF